VRINDNGIIREMTTEEIAEYEAAMARQPEPEPIEAMEAALNALGVITRE
jgi:hypothetical protein